MRSASSTCEGSPDAIRPATYLTRGEYATTRRSLALFVALVLAAAPELPQLDCLDVGLHRPSRNSRRLRGQATRGTIRHAGESLRTRVAAARAPRACRSGWSRCSSARAAPGSSAGRRPPRAGGWRTSAAARAGRRARRRAVSRTHFPSRRRTSEGDSRRPRRETNSACSSVRRAEGGARRLEVAAQRPLGGLADRHQPRLPALAGRAQRLRVEIRVAEVEVDDLLAAQAARVGELEQRPVADLERRARRDALEQRGDLVSPEHPRQPRLALLRRQQVGRVARGRPGVDEVVVKAADGGELAGDARLREPALGQRRGVAAQVAVRELARLATPFGRPRRQLQQVAPVGAQRPGRGPAGAQLDRVGVERRPPCGARLQLLGRGCRDRPALAHAASFAAPRHAPAAGRRTNRCRRASRPEPGRRARSRPRPPSGCSRARRRPERADVVGAVDPGAVVDPHPAGLERVLGAFRRRRPAGELTGPVGVGNVPDRVDLLVLDRVDAGRSVVARAPTATVYFSSTSRSFHRVKVKLERSTVM